MTIETPRQPTELSRRGLLETAVAAVAAACLGLSSSGASAQENRADSSGASCWTLVPKKSSKVEARHQSPSRSGKSCAGCRLFLAPEDCVVVEGPTTADSSCALWTDRGTGRLGCVPEPKKPFGI